MRLNYQTLLFKDVPVEITLKTPLFQVLFRDQKFVRLEFTRPKKKMADNKWKVLLGWLNCYYPPYFPGKDRNSLTEMDSKLVHIGRTYEFYWFECCRVYWNNEFNMLVSALDEEGHHEFTLRPNWSIEQTKMVILK